MFTAKRYDKPALPINDWVRFLCQPFTPACITGMYAGYAALFLQK
jgi:hypothetical protein